ncbi:hypothetical protein V6N13_102100 [Hibiscus sabdariffa]
MKGSDRQLQGYRLLSVLILQNYILLQSLAFRQCLLLHPGPRLHQSIHVEGDSLTVIKKVSSSFSNKSIIRPIISNIKSKVVFFEKITFFHVGRRGNEAAHVLAQAYQRFQLPRYWIEDAPPDVEQIALRDLRQ